MKLKHTPGPWKLVKYNVLVTEADQRKCLLGTDGDGYGMIMNDANARLIAAAPEMLEILIRLIRYYRNDKKPEAIFKLDRAIEIVEKATGQKIEEIIN